VKINSILVVGKSVIYAGRLMLNSRTRLRCVEELVTSSFESTINVGDVGEIVASLLLMFAFDGAHYKQCGAKLPQKVRLGDFISSFMGTSSELEASVKTREEIQGLFANGVVFFNHFLRLTHDPTENTLQAAFARGAALFVPFNFPGCDLIIPVFTFVIIQAKNRRNDSVTAKLIKLEAENRLAAAARRLKISSPAPPHIAIMMCLRSDEPTPNAVIVRPQAESGASPTSESDTSEIGYRWETPSRISLLGVGLNETLYPALGQYSGNRIYII
jgi:hypothetical protein